MTKYLIRVIGSDAEFSEITGVSQEEIARRVKDGWMEVSRDEFKVAKMIVEYGKANFLAMFSLVCKVLGDEPNKGYLLR